MHPVNVISNMRRWLAPLQCEFTSRGGTILALRLRDRARRESQDFVLDISRIHTEADLRIEADRIMAAVERFGFRTPLGQTPSRRSFPMSRWFRGALQRLRVAG